jgi:nucleoid-associated protein YgaU
VRKKEKVCLFLLIAITIGIHPAIAQDSGVGTKTLDLGLASDDELTQALDKASDIELVNEDNLTEAAVPAEAAPGQTTEYLEESRRLANLAEEAFSEGDYDKSAKLADEAAWLARQSDVNVAIDQAKRYLDQAVASGVSARFPSEYGEAENWYKRSIEARDSEEWDIAINAASMVAQLLESPGTSGSSSPNALPAAYTVRPWSVSRDCFWNIAGYPWVYGNPHQWRTLYNANKSKLPNPDNPNVIEPGTVLDIPSIKGEPRQGAWESGKTYEPLR